MWLENDSIIVKRMGKMFTRMVKASSVAWDELDKKINKILEELGNPKVICVEVFETNFFEGLCALLVLEEEKQERVSQGH